jgi:hypothetical protein
MGVHMMAEGAVVSCGPVPMHPKLVQSSRSKSRGESGMLTTMKVDSHKLVDVFEVQELSTSRVWHLVMVWSGDRGGKEIDGCPLTARSTLVKGIESKMAVFIWHAALGYLQWNCATFSFACNCVCTSH